MQKGLYVKCLSLEFNQNLNVLANLCTKPQLEVSTKTSLWESCRSVRTVRPTDRQDRRGVTRSKVVVSSYFVNAYKMQFPKLSCSQAHSDFEK